jgi:WD40 repeat protein
MREIPFRYTGMIAVFIGLLASQAGKSEELKPRATLTGNGDVVRSVAFNPTGDKLASGSSDNTLRLWKGV